ncbi:MAG TPA: hypothetical protein VMY37_40640 [Thermoguttaceae bacterium]|nr:hypothetical protein [Thermoguttaceae bacterium]
MKFWLSVAVAVVSMWLCSTVYGGGVKVGTDEATQGVEMRVLFDWGENWSLGPVVDWADAQTAEDNQIWGIGAAVEFSVDPNATVPLSDWLMGLTGDWLPETVVGHTYLVGTGKLANVTERPVWVFSGGPGISFGPLYVEYRYQLADGGQDADGVQFESGPVLSFGLKPIEF